MITLDLVDSMGVMVSAQYDHDGHDHTDLLAAIKGWSGGVAVKVAELPRLNHGNFKATVKRTGRTLTVSFNYERQTRQELWAIERKFSGLFSDGSYGLLTVKQDNLELSCEVRLDGQIDPEVNIDQGWISIQVPLFSELPYLYSPWRETPILPVGSGVGLEYDLFSKDLGKGPILTFGSAIEQDSMVWNNGNARSYPVGRFYLDAPGGFIYGLGNKYISYPWPCYPDVPITIDHTGSILIGGFDQSHMLGEREWSWIEPGAQELPTLDLIQGGAGYGIISHRDTFI